jgi:starch phosphorylase
MHDEFFRKQIFFLERGFMAFDLDYQAEMLMLKTRHYLITVMGRILEEASNDEVYWALSHALREEIMINWLATSQTIARHNSRIIYYLSMEYLPGRFCSNNITNISAVELVNLSLRKMDRTFSDIIGRELDPGLGNGGLGRLASCFLDSLATQHYPAQAYGLRYQYGIFEQQIWNGIQIEAPDCWLLNENPWEFRRDLRKVFVQFCGMISPGRNIHGDEIFSLKEGEEVGVLPFDIPIIGYSKEQKFSVVPLRLWSTKESPRNFQLQRYNAGRLDQAAENAALTDVLYPSDHHETGKRIRLKQEFLLVSASLQDIIRHYRAHHENFRDFADKVRIQINDTHPALVIPELTRLLITKYDIPWKMAVEMTKTCTGYTNHTILAEALEQWDQNLLSYLLPAQAKVIERFNLEFCDTVRKKYPNDEDKVRRMSIIENGMVRMANLAIVGSHSVNGVSEIHSEILKKEVFPDFYELFPDKFVNVTNGVTERRWLLHCNPELSKFITKRIGDKWITDFTHVRELANFARDPESQEELLLIKKRNKLRLIDYIKHYNRMRNKNGEPTICYPVLDEDALFDVQVKRFHEYKRQLLSALHLIMLYHELLENPESRYVKRLFIYAGKAAAGYETAKNIIRLIFCIARKINNTPSVSKLLKVVFIENYNVSKAELIIPAADLSEQISTAGTEASGTGNMKLTINGALTIGTEDGANIEMKRVITEEWWPFTFGCTVDEIRELQARGSYNPWDFCTNYPKIRKAVDSLRDNTFAQDEQEHNALSSLYYKLLEGHLGEPADKYFILKDLLSYYNVQKKVEELFLDPKKWAEFCMHNIAGMAGFSTDSSIKNYADKIWGIEPCPLDDDILERVRDEYSKHDQCRIYRAPSDSLV